MQKLEMMEVKASRHNLTGFLHFTDIAKLNILFNGMFNVSKESFDDICDKALELKASKLLSHKKVSDIFDILQEANKSFRAESHRIDACHAIFEYNESDNNYYFMKKGTQREFNALVHYL